MKSNNLNEVLYDELSNKKDNSSYLRYGQSADNKRHRKYNKSSDKKIHILHEIYSSAVLFLFVFVFIFGIEHYVLQHAVVDGKSMETSFYDSDHILIDKITYDYNMPERFDIIVFEPYDDDDCYYIKRVIGLPGETIQIINNEVYINGELVDDKYTIESYTDSGIAQNEITLKENEYFVMGDNRPVSLDSRDATVGPVSASQIIGKVRAVIWPIKHIKICN